ncbi:histidine phosphatase family protein [Billgrantia gudaonensis]|uniref:Histidine phosphatase family protein n=1 Tax=Billgrantia gudaonensis TaxID=376427 RepID=A0A432JJF6_9GAMM|nr:histidine phosphatase family protein [Halomonas gudaonensis]
MSNGRFHAVIRRRNRYLLMRHGHSEAQGVIVSRPQHGLQDYGLFTGGHAQLAWSTTGVGPLHPSLAFSFPAHHRDRGAVATHFGLTAHPDLRLRERDFGSLEGEPDDRYPRLGTRCPRPDHCDFGVESVMSVAERMVAVIDALEREYRQKPYCWSATGIRCRSCLPPSKSDR